MIMILQSLTRIVGNADIQTIFIVFDHVYIMHTKIIALRLSLASSASLRALDLHSSTYTKYYRKWLATSEPLAISKGQVEWRWRESNSRANGVNRTILRR